MPTDRAALLPGSRSIRRCAPRASEPDAPVAQPLIHWLSGLSLEEISERAGLKRIDVVAWRDFDDPEAGGSELHAHRVITAWSNAGLDVSMTTSSVPGSRTVVRRDGYRVIRRAGRYSVFPRTMLSGALGRIGSGDGLVEIWNGMPFFSPTMVPLSSDRLPPSRARGDVEDGSPLRNGRMWLRHRAPSGTPCLSEEPDRDAVQFIEARDRRSSPYPVAIGCRSHHRVSSPSSSPRASDRRPRLWLPSAVWCRSSGSTC